MTKPFDLSKLTPAPWVTAPFKTDRESGCTYLDLTDAIFIALARNAFDVMQRRGWGVSRLENGRWVIENPDRRGWVFINDRNWIFATLIEAYEGLVEADKWLTQEESQR